MKLTPVMNKFILHWGEMGTKWGINRSVAQIHALLYITGRPLPADEIVELLSIARSNVSTALKELQGWGIVRVAHTMGDRRDHFEALADVWETFHHILIERKRREADPTLRLLRECADEAAQAKKTADDEMARQRLADMLEFFEIANTWGERAGAFSPKTLKRFAKMGDAIFKLAGSG
ncbi:MAG TPA: MarR family transcriptional regulator [Opitutaceae bacterium]|jgi:DNA-binding transcriptional regulator GbsR (MarR family)|nr:MarR family transcriptional regulator [Opitutaceae bacterium]